MYVCVFFLTRLLLFCAQVPGRISRAWHLPASRLRQACTGDCRLRHARQLSKSNTRTRDGSTIKQHHQRSRLSPKTQRTCGLGSSSSFRGAHSKLSAAGPTPTAAALSASRLAVVCGHIIPRAVALAFGKLPPILEQARDAGSVIEDSGWLQLAPYFSLPPRGTRRKDTADDSTPTSRPHLSQHSSRPPQD